MLATVTNATMDAPCTMTVECTHARQVCEGGSCTCRRIHGVVGEHCHELTWISVWAISSVACNLCMHLVAALCCVRAKQTVVAPRTITCALLCALLMFAEELTILLGVLGPLDALTYDVLMQTLLSLGAACSCLCFFGQALDWITMVLATRRLGYVQVEQLHRSRTVLLGCTFVFGGVTAVFTLLQALVDPLYFEVFLGLVALNAVAVIGIYEFAARSLIALQAQVSSAANSGAPSTLKVSATAAAELSAVAEAEQSEEAVEVAVATSVALDAADAISSVHIDNDRSRSPQHAREYVAASTCPSVATKTRSRAATDDAAAPSSASTRQVTIALEAVSLHQASGAHGGRCTIDERSTGASTGTSRTVIAVALIVRTARRVALCCLVLLVSLVAWAANVATVHAVPLEWLSRLLANASIAAVLCVIAEHTRTYHERVHRAWSSREHTDPPLHAGPGVRGSSASSAIHNSARASSRNESASSPRRTANDASNGSHEEHAASVMWSISGGSSGQVGSQVPV